ncbi:TniQ family protein [Pseudomonas sp. NPDC089569]|uniref:TniQ family protein n=1 Tax=Pseudomonas sp. NPDC089569 TaxID=3390722 RepID=UPI003D01FEC1
MRRSALYRGLLKPLPQEALSSWLVRGGRSKNYLPFLRATECLTRHGAIDADATLSAKVEGNLSKTLGLPVECFQQSFPAPSDWLKMPPFRRNQVCEHCLYDDFRTDRHPALRNTWFYWWFNVCPVHGCLLLENMSSLPPETGFSASDALFGLLQRDVLMDHLEHLEHRYAPWYTPTTPFPWRRMNQALVPFKKLRAMALYFQHWYLRSLKRGEFVIGNIRIAATIDEWHLFMGDLLAIIGKKRSYPFDRKSYIARLLDLKSWSTLSSSFSPAGGCEPFLCVDIGEHPPKIRMAMFALLGLFLKLPGCVRVWQLGRDTMLDDRYIERFWRGMHSDADRQPSYLQWLKQRATGWNPSIKEHFRYLLNDPSGRV